MTRKHGFTTIDLAGMSHASLPPELQKAPNVVHAFADDRFSGNPAGVVILREFPQAEQMQAAAHYAKLPTTAFVAPSSDHDELACFDIRWFTPSAELELCGHATLAAAHWLFTRGEVPGHALTFGSRSGVLAITRAGDAITMSFPRILSVAADRATARTVSDALGVPLVECRRAYDDLIAVVAEESIVTRFVPDFAAIRGLECRGVVLTARTDPNGSLAEYDIVSRFFAPEISIDEDQVCVSAHCKLQPYWSERLGRSSLRALQASASGGRLGLDARGDRVLIEGSARFGDIDGIRHGTVACGPVTTCAIGVTMREFDGLASEHSKAPFRLASFRVAPGCATVAEAHDVAELWHLSRGHGRAVVDGRSIELKAGDSVQFAPRERHQLHNVGDEAIEAVSIRWEVPRS
ncbi:PhzF family phenazine biosynthesis isomerase [Paraburkholderia sp. CNPSo 3076]|uniref:PhzF family phenazine biosynthesis isomerase n=1 Tax=Paraburkholderia sp. CNPSo 3076 TaxID=2940936 RepID=UPI00224DC837|nr:PhzF family phenazine biosynthesis isomerase [Paraburkholderia sp. CNPSo 3076]MCX5545792.1 PhzF family phenazine biosynthesis isomerase [Paraburkholderia sp. CNPSo 3076]